MKAAALLLIPAFLLSLSPLGARMMGDVAGWNPAGLWQERVGLQLDFGGYMSGWSPQATDTCVVFDLAWRKFENGLAGELAIARLHVPNHDEYSISYTVAGLKDDVTWGFKTLVFLAPEGGMGVKMGFGLSWKKEIFEISAFVNDVTAWTNLPLEYVPGVLGLGFEVSPMKWLSLHTGVSSVDIRIFDFHLGLLLDFDWLRMGITPFYRTDFSGSDMWGIEGGVMLSLSSMMMGADFEYNWGKLTVNRLKDVDLPVKVVLKLGVSM